MFISDGCFVMQPVPSTFRKQTKAMEFGPWYRLLCSLGRFLVYFSDGKRGEKNKESEKGKESLAGERQAYPILIYPGREKGANYTGNRLHCLIGTLRSTL